ncbi:Lanthionine synthetase C-like - like 2 [Theobroma cacao]|uniref:LanC-like protein GCL2 isoform X1 n=1 Tax=Theobroma cacao TaxID=3641 RepID=A0AB32W379_THECC|nr:PREDICTED: lanC-like protein GCL2 isoform X1 [Theobroma cacao]WRX15813.1 Lanthionine synthetase C-like - like 2 [Theobroma cacao]
MADRFFPNVLPDFVSETTEQKEEVGDTLMKLLSMPYSSLSQHFKRAALDLKETVTLDTWGLTGQKVSDFTLYCGTLGTAFLLFKSYQLANNTNDLSLCLAIVDACNSASFSSRDVTFLCGRAGVCALGAVAAKHAGNQELLDYYLSQFKEIKLSSNLPDELLYGRAGFLWACVFLNKHLGEGTIPSTTTRAVVDEVIKNGRQLAKKGGGSPLMFEFYGEKYWGAAHGLAGIMHVLMDMELEPDEIMDVKGTLKYMIRNRFPSGNYPASEQDRKRDVLVHWCHGAPGIALTLVKAAEVFGDDEFLEAAVDAAEVVFNRGLLKRVGICHGISGNAYVFLSLYRKTGNVEFLYRAKAFACLLLDRAHKLISKGEMHGGDRPYSLFEGIGGMAYLFLDMIEPLGARFPAYEF